MKKIIRIFLFLISASLIILNITPIITSGEKNIGIITGFLISAVALLYGLFFEKVNGFIRKLWDKNIITKIAFGIISVALCVGISVGTIAAFCILSHGKTQEKETEYVIVLGCLVKEGGKPGINLKLRIDKAYEYLTAHPKSKAILSGGQGDIEDLSEAQCMYNELVKMGIDPSRLIVEDGSFSTRENFANSVEILKNQGIKINEITVITNEFHEYRAGKFAERNGLTAYSYSAKTGWNWYTPFSIREIYAVVWQIYLNK